MADSRVALVTGSNRGIGFEVCRQLATAGCRVVLTGRDRAKAECSANVLRADGLDVSAAVLDVTDGGSIRSLADRIIAQYSGLDILVNNGAILVGEDASILETSVADLRATLETNLIGAIAVSQAFVPHMMTRGYGRLVNVSSGAGQLAKMTTYAPAYSISKTALNAFTRRLAAETRGTGVLVNSADPGWVRTDMGGPNAPRSVEQGADTIVWLATLPDDGPTGGFFSNRRAIPW